MMTERPTHFKTDGGRTFEIEVMKVNKRTYWIGLLDSKGVLVKKIKVRKDSERLLVEQKKGV